MKPNSYLTVHTALDQSSKNKQRFFLRSLTGTEVICQDFKYSLQLGTLQKLSQNEIKSLLGASLSIEIRYLKSSNQIASRFINGLIYQVQEIGMSRSPLFPDVWQYKIQIGSWLKKLGFIKDCRIFQKNGNDSYKLVAELLREYNCFDFRSDISGNLPRKDYAVLYNESIRQFIERILREDGISWRFEHSENKHTLVFTDDTTQNPGIKSFLIGPQDAFEHFCRMESYQPVKQVEEASFDWQNQQVQKKSGKTGNTSAKHQQYLYRGGFEDQQQSELKVKTQCSALESQAERYKGESTIRSLAAGKIIELHAPSLHDLHGKSFLIVELNEEATDQEYRNSFVAIPASKPYSPLRHALNDQPRIPGVQTAVVVGEGESETVQTDDLGRVRVRFRWDHLSPKDSTKTSAYLRVAKPAAGATRGFLFNPRIGEEVIVDFEDGCPEKPFIVGSLYSKYNPPPFPPSSKPHYSIIKNSPQPDSNQVLFNDTPNAEKLEIIARKDMNIDVKHEMKIDVKKDATVTSKGSYIIASEGVDIKAGNNISNRSLATILSFAMAVGNNTAGGNILNLAAGLVMQSAGGVLSNLAGLLVANTSILGMTQSADAKVTNESKMLMLNTASEVINAGESAVENKAALAIINYANTEQVNKGGSKKDKIALFSSTQSKTNSVTAKTTVGPV